MRLFSFISLKNSRGRAPDPPPRSRQRRVSLKIQLMSRHWQFFSSEHKFNVKLAAFKIVLKCVRFPSFLYKLLGENPQPSERSLFHWNKVSACMIITYLILSMNPPYEKFLVTALCRAHFNFA